MKLAFGGVVVFACVLGLSACSSDNSKNSGSSGAAAGAGGDAAAAPNGNGGEPATTPADACQVGCAATLAAECSKGPTDQASCESTCHALEAGKCGAEYATFQSCAEGEAVTCGTGALDGIPVVSACSDEQTAFIACING